MGNSDSETEVKGKKEKKHKDKDSGDERKEKRDREKDEKKGKKDKGKEERKEKKDKEKEHGDKDKGKEKTDKGKEEKKEKREKGKEDKDKEKDEKKKHKEDKYHDDKKHKPSHPSGSESHASSGPIDAHDGKATSHSKPSGVPVPGETPWFLREPDTVPVHQQPSQINPDFPTPSPPHHQYSVQPPSQQQPFRAVEGGVPSTQSVPPSGHRVPLSPNDHFPTPDRLGPPPATDSGGSIPVYIGSAIFPDSVHPCRIVPSLNPPCRVLYGGGEVEHHGRYDLLPITQDMEWVPAKLGELPPGRRPVEGGYESNGNKLYHALGSVQGAYVLGKAGQHLRGAIIPFGGNEHHVQENYSVLCWK